MTVRLKPSLKRHEERTLSERHTLEPILRSVARVQRRSAAKRRRELRSENAFQFQRGLQRAVIVYF